MKKVRHCKVAIIGAGVSAGGSAFMLGFTNVKSVTAIEKDSSPGQENSNPRNNAQTSHDGSTETNYWLKKALIILIAAIALRLYVVRRNTPGLYAKTNRMVLAVGTDEVELIRKRYEEFKPSYPDLRFIGPDELRELEPKVMEGRNPAEPVAAIVTTEGYAINYQKLAECFMEDAEATIPEFEALYNTKVTDVRRENGKYILETTSGTVIADVVVFAAGGYSLSFAHKLGYGLKYGILPVAGDFYSTTNGPLLKGKVYRPQIEGIPFAASHGDPDVLNPQETRFGPTTLPLPMFERRHYDSIIPYLTSRIASWRGVASLFKILWERNLVGYVAWNFTLRIPVIGKWLFVQQMRKIVPTLRYDEVALRMNAGGIRPQIVNMETGELEMGEQMIVGDHCIFLTTPSPGASVCLANGFKVIKQIKEFLGDEFTIDFPRIKAELRLE